MIKPLVLIPLLAQLSIAPSIGEGNTAPAIGEAPPPAEVEPPVEPVAVQAEPQPVEITEQPQAPVNIPVPEPLPEDSVDLAPPLEQPALEENEQWDDIPPPPPENPAYDPSPSETPPYPQGQAPQPVRERDLQRPPIQQRDSAPTHSAVAYRPQVLPIQPPVQRITETIGYPLTTHYPVTSRFGWRRHPVEGAKRFHAGIDLGAPHGTPTLSMLSGQVVRAGWEGGYGKSVVIEHPGTGLKTRYAHLSKIHVQPGQWVDQGWHIGDSGATGLVTGPHAHIEMVFNGKPVDPWPYLAQASRQALLLGRFHPWAG